MTAGLRAFAPCAYVLARQQGRPWRILTFYFMASTTVPVQLYLFPLYFIYAKLGLVNSIPAVALIYTATFSPFAIFLLRTYVLSIPFALEEAAQVDGARPWQMFLYVILPMMRPGLLTVAIIVGLNAWNEFAGRRRDDRVAGGRGLCAAAAALHRRHDRGLG